jgi:hypothetical protein
MPQKNLRQSLQLYQKKYQVLLVFVLLLEQEGKRVQIECDHLPHEYEKMLVEILLLENINVLPEVVLLVFK